MLELISLLLICVCKYATCLPCLTDESKKSFNDSRKALAAIENYIGETLNSVRTDIRSKLKNIHDKLDGLEEGFNSKYQLGHMKINYKDHVSFFTIL